MFCGNCGYENPAEHKFCAMCGQALLKPQPLRSQEAARSFPAAIGGEREPVWANEPMQQPISQEDSAVETPPVATRTATGRSLHGPSFLGLNDEGESREDASYLLEDEPASTSWRSMLALLLVAAFVGIVVYQWKYSGSRGSTPPPSAAQPAQQEKKAEPPSPAPSEPVAAVREHTDTPPAAGAAQQAEPEQPTPSPGEPSRGVAKEQAERKAETAKPAPEEEDAESAELEPAAKESKGGGTSETASARPSHKPALVDKNSAIDDSLLLKAEQYLYGRGVPRSCGQALIYLRAAAQHANPKARSRLGALYATGQCVPQDRAIAYRYFTQALNSGQGNVWLERNRAMLWREMSAEERQRALQ